MDDAIVIVGRDVPEPDEVIGHDETPWADRLLQRAGRRCPDYIRRPDFLQGPEIRPMVQLVRWNPVILPMARQEGHLHARVHPDPRRIARRSVWGDEEPRLFLLQLERVAEGGSSDDSDDGGRHGVGRTALPR